MTFQGPHTKKLLPKINNPFASFQYPFDLIGTLEPHIFGPKNGSQ